VTFAITSSVTPEQTAQGLRSAGQAVRDRGMCRGELGNSLGELCAMGAIELTLSDTPLNLHGKGGQNELVTLRNAMVSALAELLPEPPPRPFRRAPEKVREFLHTRYKVTYFNDYVCSGGDELALFFDTAAEKIEANLP
jgi:hypothetical protein